MDKNYLKEKIELATQAVEDVSDATLKEAAFKCVLTSLLSQKSSASVTGDANLVPNPKSSALKVTLGADADVWQQVFKVVDEVIELNVKVEASSVAEQQRKLAHALLLGYKILLNVTEVTGPTMLKVAKEWDIPTKDFVRNVNASEYIQSKNKGRGKDPKYSLKPGSIDKLTPEIKNLAEHE